MAVTREPNNRWTELMDRQVMEAISQGMWPLGLRDELYCGDWAPAADIADIGDKFLIRIEVPGITKDNLKIEIEKNLLVVSGTRTKGMNEEQARLIRSERRCGSFVRSFRLPENIDRAAISAALTDGIADITIPKVEEAKPKKVQISVE